MSGKYPMVIALLERIFGKRGSRIIFCLVLMTFGISHTEIQSRCGVALSTLRRYRKSLKSEGIDSLFIVTKRQREQSELDSYEDKIMSSFDKNPPKTLREAQSRIENMTGLKRSFTRLRVWLQKRGFILGQ
jgi:transposase